MNLVTQIAKDIAAIGSIIADIGLSGKERLAVDIAARWISYAADNIDKLIEGGVDLKDLRLDDPETRIKKYLDNK